MEINSKCAKCGLSNTQRACRDANGVCPGFCPTNNCEEQVEKAKEIYKTDPGLHRFAVTAAIQESDKSFPGTPYPSKTRIYEIVEFCKRMGYKHLGLAFCGGLHDEAKIVNKILENNGFEVTSVVCKVGCLKRDTLGLHMDKEGVNPYTMCNPVGQAMILNEAKTEFNILLGLCVGHDSMFLKYSDALCTVFAVKDRAMGNNPLAAIYNAGAYCRYIYEPLEDVEVVKDPVFDEE